MAAEKITKKQLKEDEFINFFAKIVFYLRTHIRKIGVGALVLAALAAVFAGVYFYRHSFDEKAAYQMSKALEVYHQAVSVDSSGSLIAAKELLEAVIKEYPSSPAAEAARYYVGNCYFFKGDYDNALTAYENYLKKHSSGTYAPMAKEGQAQSWTAKKDLINAAKEYENLIKTYGAYPMLPEVLMTLGQLYERMNNPNEALRIYKLLVDKFPESQEKIPAQKRIEILRKS